MLSFRVPDELAKLLEKVAVEEERSKAFIIKKALQTYLEDLIDYRIAEEGYKRYIKGGKNARTLDEVAKDLGVELRHYKSKKS